MAIAEAYPTIAGSESAATAEQNPESEFRTENLIREEQLPKIAQSEESDFDRYLRWAGPDVPNIAKELEAETLHAIGQRVVEEYEIDEQSRKQWLSDGEKALELAMQRTEQKSWPWPKASNVIVPIMTEAADQFAARCYPAIISGPKVVKGTVVGRDQGLPLLDEATGQQLVNPTTGKPAWIQGFEPGAKQARSTRISEHMSWQLLEEQEEWEPETDVMLHVLPIMGCEFRKSFFDPAEGRNMALRVSAKRLCVNYWAKSLQLAPRLTEIVDLYPYEIRERQQAGMFLPGDYLPPINAANDPQAPHVFLEQHRRLDLDGDGYSEPYIVTVHKETREVVRIVARFDPDGVKIRNAKLQKIIPVHYYTKYDFLPNKEGGIYGMGFGQLLKPLNEAINTALNMLIDAGHLQNTGGGLISSRLNMPSGAVKVGPGEFKTVQTAGADIRNAVYMFEHKGPSAALLSLLGTLIEMSKSISSVKDVLTGEVKAETISPTVFLALVEQGLKVFTAIYKRIYRSLKAEFDKQFRLNRLYLEEHSQYRLGNEWRDITRQDYLKGGGVEPVADPTMVSAVQKLAKAQMLGEFKDDPLMDGVEIRRRMLEAAEIEQPEKLLRPAPPPNPEAIAKLAELEIRKMEAEYKRETARADAVLKYAQALKAMAEVDVAISEDQLAWAAAQTELIRANIEVINAGRDAASAAPAGTGGADAGSMGGMEAPPANGGIPPLPQGLPGANGSGAPGAVA